MSESAYLRLSHSFDRTVTTDEQDVDTQVWQIIDVMLHDATFNVTWDYDRFLDDAEGLQLFSNEDCGYEYALWHLSGLRKFEQSMTTGLATADPLDSDYGDLLTSIREAIALFDAGKVENCGGPEDPVIYFKIW